MAIQDLVHFILILWVPWVGSRISGRASSFEYLASDGMKESPEKPWLESLKFVLQSSRQFLRLLLWHYQASSSNHNCLQKVYLYLFHSFSIFFLSCALIISESPARTLCAKNNATLWTLVNLPPYMHLLRPLQCGSSFLFVLFAPTLSRHFSAEVGLCTSTIFELRFFFVVLSFPFGIVLQSFDKKCPNPCSNIKPCSIPAPHSASSHWISGLWLASTIPHSCHTLRWRWGWVAAASSCVLPFCFSLAPAATIWQRYLLFHLHTFTNFLHYVTFPRKGSSAFCASTKWHAACRSLFPCSDFSSRNGWGDHTHVICPRKKTKIEAWKTVKSGWLAGLSIKNDQIHVPCMEFRQHGVIVPKVSPQKILSDWKLSWMSMVQKLGTNNEFIKTFSSFQLCCQCCIPNFCLAVEEG